MTETTQPSDVSAATLPRDLSHAMTPAGPDLAGGHGHGHDEAAPLGPADWGAWAGGLLGVAAGLLVAACLWLSTSGL